MAPVAALFLFGAGISLEKSVLGPGEELSGSVEGLAGEEELVWEDPDGAEMLRLGLRPGPGGAARFSFPVARAWSRENVLKLGSGASIPFTVRLDPLFSGVEEIWEEGGEWRASSGRGERPLAGPLVRSDEFLPSLEDVERAARQSRLTRSSDALVRAPCLSGPLADELRSRARERTRLDAWGTVLFEELGFLPAGVRADLCFCRDCLRACAARGLPPASALDEARETDNLAGWCAHRLFMSSLAGKLDLGSFPGPGALKVGLCGAYSIMPGSLEKLSWCAFRDELSAWAASGLVPGLNVVAPSRGQWEPGNRGFLGRDGFLPRRLRSYLARAETVWDDAAVVYSPESALASYALDSSRASLPFHPPPPFEETWRKTLSSWLLLLRDCSFDPRAVSPERLPSSGMLVLPRTCALSDDACDSMRAFARRGGTVLADCMTAVYDGLCRKRARGGLDDLFGIEQKGAAPAELCGRVYPLGVGMLKWQKAGDPAVLLRRGRLGGFSAAEKGVFLKGGAAAARAGSTDAFIARREGAGLAAFLNVCVTLYPEMRKRPEGKLLRAVVRALAAEARVRPGARVLGRESGPRVRTLEWGGTYLVWLKGEDLGGSKVELDCPFVPCVYDALTGELLGRSHTVELPDPPAGRSPSAGEGPSSAVAGTATEGEGPDERYLSLLPARVSLALGALTGGGKAVRGGEFSFELASVGSKVNHLVELRLYDPFGRELERRRRPLVLRGGVCEFAVHFALNDPPGLWKVEVLDALTKRTGSTRLVVE